MFTDKEERRYYKISSLHKVFALSSTLLFCATLWLVVNDYAADWKHWQKKFAGLEEAESKKKSQPGFKNTPEYANKQSGHVTEQISPVSKTVASYIRDTPLLDFFNPSLKLKQIILEDFSFDLKFARASRVDRCVSCHIPVTNSKYTEGELPLKTHPRKELFLSLDSPHPIQSFGCSICHQGRDRGTSFNSSAHFPDTQETGIEWRRKYRWKPLESWKYPMIPSRYIESSCLLCHEKESRLKGAAKLNEGRRLINRLGCRGCHTIPGDEKFRKPGPSLLNISAKLSKSWVKEWILNPTVNNRHTNMPLFFPANNEISKQKVSDRLDAIVEFLFYQSGNPPLSSVPMSGNVKRGRNLFSSIGCTACHPVPGKEGAPETALKSLFNLKQKVNRRWLIAWLKAPQKLAPETLMPDFSLSDAEAADIAEYLLKEPDDSRPPRILKNKSAPRDEKREKSRFPANSRKAVIELGKKLVSRYGCFGCHEIKGFENSPPVGPDLGAVGSKPVKNFDFGMLKGQIESSRHSWLFKKIENPRAFNGKREVESLVMPVYNLSYEQIDSIVTYLLGLTAEEIPEFRKKRLPESEERREAALEIIEERHCLACHTLNGEGGRIKESLFTEPEKSAHLLPPALDGEGGMVQPQWLFNFLKKPSTIRPWLSVRMPNFNLSNKEAETIVNFFSISEERETIFDDTRAHNISDEEIRYGKEIFTLLKCNSCHMTGKTGSLSPGTIGPDLSLAKHRLRRAWIKKWLEEPQKLKKGTRMPTNWIKVTRRGKTRYILPPSLKDFFEGDVKKQISSVTAYLMTL